MLKRKSAPEEDEFKSLLRKNLHIRISGQFKTLMALIEFCNGCATEAIIASSACNQGFTIVQDLEKSETRLKTEKLHRTTLVFTSARPSTYTQNSWPLLQLDIVGPKDID